MTSWTGEETQWNSNDVGVVRVRQGTPRFYLLLQFGPPLSSVQVRNEWICTSSPPYSFTTCTGFPFSLRHICRILDSALTQSGTKCAVPFYFVTPDSRIQGCINIARLLTKGGHSKFMQNRVPIFSRLHDRHLPVSCNVGARL